MKVVHRMREAIRRLRDRRRAGRVLLSGVVAFYWDGAMPRSHPVRDISRRGAYVITEERWYVGTVVRFTIQSEDAAEALHGGGEKKFMTVRSRVVRHGRNGVGLEFLLLSRSERRLVDEFLKAVMPQARVPDEPSNCETGNALVEFALVIPLLFLLIVNTINFGGFLYAWIEIANAARTGAQYATMGPAQLGVPNTPATSAIMTAVTNDAYSLLNKSSLQVCVTKNHNGTVTSSGNVTGACSSAAGAGTPSDPEASSYDMAAIDVTYTYAPFIPLWDFAKLNIHATLPATTIHRKAVMRILQ